MSPAADKSETDGPETAGAPQVETGAQREIAIALSHDTGDDQLPKVIASGEGAVARQILEIAFARGIKVREDADLAEVLSAIDVDSDIPLTALAAVAEILSYVYQASADHEAPRPPETDDS